MASLSSSSATCIGSDETTPVTYLPEVIENIELPRRHGRREVNSLLELSDGTMLTAGSYGIWRWTSDFSTCIQKFNHTRSTVSCLVQLDYNTFLKRWRYQIAAFLTSVIYEIMTENDGK